MKHITDNVTKNNNDCWLWQKSCSSAGYGQFTKNKVYWNTHRYVWQHLNGPIPKDQVVRHTCHERACCNPAHLKLGTHADNYQDSMQTHNEAASLRRMVWKIQNIKYSTCAEAVKVTKISISSIIKYTNKLTRVFDVEAYRAATKIAGWRPKI